MADTILIVDDDCSVSAMLTKAVQSSGMEADTAGNGEDALRMLKEKRYDLILMDINMPGIDGFQAVELIRRQGIQTPIIIISGRVEELDTLYGLNIGADDYITKPLQPMILTAKIKALIRRSRNDLPGSSQQVSVGPFTYHTSTLRFYKHEQEIPLSAKENAIIKLFMDNENRIFSKDMLYELIWGDSLVDENAVMVYINRLRQKIEDDPSDPRYIRTVRGLGYRFVV